ncbi:helix-turn-helix transcriptional regulator [Castellaniella sp. WN]
MHNPPHPGEFISGIYLEPNGISGRELAEKLGVAASWFAMQDAHDLWVARQHVDLDGVGKLKLAVA